MCRCVPCTFICGTKLPGTAVHDLLCLTGRPGPKKCQTSCGPHPPGTPSQGPPASPRLKQHHRIGEHGLPRAVMLRALSWCILARREHNSVLHMLSATPTCHPYWWCAGAGITLERHSMLRHENHCRCPYTYVSLRVLLCTTFCQVEATPQLYQFLSPESPRPLPVRLIGTPTPLRFLFPTATIAHLREGVRLNLRFPL